MDSDSRIKDLIAQNEEQKKEIDSMQKMIQRKDERIQTLEADLLRTQKEVSNLKVKITEKNDLLTQYLKDQTKPAFKHRMGISAEPLPQQECQLKYHNKDMRAKELIIRAINKNEFLRNLEDIQMNEIVECMYQKEFKKEQFICREGAIGTELYVIAQGEVQVTVDGQLRAEMGVGKLFGELAILYNCTRTATIKAKTDTLVWALDRSGYQAIMMNLGMLRQTRYMKIFKSLPVLSGLQQKDLLKIADVLTEDFYKDGDYIIRQGASGDVFFIISEGTVRVTQQQGVDSPEVTIQELKAGDYFGEKALLGNTYRTANVIATSDVSCLSLDKENFSQLIGNVVERKYKDDEDSKTKIEDTVVEDEVVKLLSSTTLEDYKKLSTLGMGGFGRVELVQLKSDPNKTYALKCLRKRHVVDTHQQAHLHSERTIMLSCKSPFITRLYKTFRCPKYLYMLLEVSLGGELWTILRNRSNFDNAQTRFCTACVLEALQYLHSKEIVYRDLKPENLLLDTTGYIKLVDFGFAKHIGGRKTWTFCGTPEYVAPEIILNKGHDISADYWSLGILIYELLTGSPPFSASDPMRTYNVILKGIDVVEFPKKVTRTATHLIKKLCRNNPAQRIGNLQGGIQDIKSHRWFQGFDWEGLKRHSMVPPIVPNVRGPTDTSNFDKFPPDMSSIPPDDLTGWDKEFGDLQNSPSWLLRGF